MGLSHQQSRQTTWEEGPLKEPGGRGGNRASPKKSFASSSLLLRWCQRRPAMVFFFFVFLFFFQCCRSSSSSSLFSLWCAFSCLCIVFSPSSWSGGISLEMREGSTLAVEAAGMPAFFFPHFSSLHRSRWWLECQGKEHTSSQTNRNTDRQTNGLPDRPTDRLTQRLGEPQTQGTKDRDRHTDRQTVLRLRVVKKGRSSCLVGNGVRKWL